MVAGGAAFTRLEFEDVGQFFAKLFWIANALAFIVQHNVLFQILGRVVFQVIHFLQWTHLGFRCAVAIEAEAHRVRLGVIDDIHLIDLTVATHTGNAAIDVRAVAKLYVVGCLVDFHPLNRFAVVKWMRFVHRTMQGLQLRAVATHVLVAVPASVRRWQIRVVGIVHK